MFARHAHAYQAILAIVALYCVAAVALTGNVLFFMFDDRPSAFMLRITLLPIACWYGIVTFKLLRSGRPRPMRRLARYTRRHRAWLLRAFLLIVAIIVWASAFTVAKMQIPKWMPYYADPAFVAMDRAIFGADPWTITHALIGPAGTRLLDMAYAGWFVVMMGFLAWAAASRDTRFQTTSLLSFLLCFMLLGGLGATLMSSVGPCFYQRFYGDADFVALTDRIHAGGYIASHAMQYLDQMHGKSAYANGISAMPSMHVATSVWFVMMARAGAKSVLPFALALGFAATIFVGSVHLGWHYAVDGVFSILAVPPIWWASQWFVDRRPAAVTTAPWRGAATTATS